MDRLKLML